MFHIIAFLGMVRDYVRDALGTILAITHVVLKLLFSNDDESKTRPHFRRLGITYRETLKISAYRFGSTIERAVTCRPCFFFFFFFLANWGFVATLPQARLLVSFFPTAVAHPMSLFLVLFGKSPNISNIFIIFVTTTNDPWSLMVMTHWRLRGKNLFSDILKLRCAHHSLKTKGDWTL